MNKDIEKIEGTKYWRTKELLVAAYLFATKGILVGVHPDESGVVFVFLDTMDRQNCMKQFQHGDSRIELCGTWNNMGTVAAGGEWPLKTHIPLVTQPLLRGELIQS